MTRFGLYPPGLGDSNLRTETGSELSDDDPQSMVALVGRRSATHKERLGGWHGP